MKKRAQIQRRGRNAVVLGGLCLAGVLVAPLAVYLFGSTLMGPYDGEAGLAGFLSAVYNDVLKARPGAIALVLSPSAFVLVWWLIVRLIRQSPARPAGNGA